MMADIIDIKTQDKIKVSNDESLKIIYHKVDISEINKKMDNFYTKIQNNLITAKLKPESKIILMYLLSKETIDTWIYFSQKEISESTNISLASVKRSIQELKIKGYLKIDQKRDAKGKLINILYEIFERPSVLVENENRKILEEKKIKNKKAHFSILPENNPCLNMSYGDTKTIENKESYPCLNMSYGINDVKNEENTVKNDISVSQFEPLPVSHIETIKNKREEIKDINLTPLISSDLQNFQVQSKEEWVEENKKNKILSELLRLSDKDGWKDRANNLVKEYSLELIQDWLNARPFFPQDVRSFSWYIEDSLRSNRRLPEEFIREKSRKKRERYEKEWKLLFDSIKIESADILDRVVIFAGQLAFKLLEIKKYFESPIDYKSNDINRREALKIQGEFKKILEIKPNLQLIQALMTKYLKDLKIKKYYSELRLLDYSKVDSIINQVPMIRYYAEKEI